MNSPPLEAPDDYITTTLPYWQALLPADTDIGTPPYRYDYPARLPDGQVLKLPLRRSPSDPQRAVASFIANQAAFDVIDAVSSHMTPLVLAEQPEVIIGLPTLGMVFAPLVAQQAGFNNYIPFGYSRKYWYDERLAVPVRSITTPGAGKLLYLDPHLKPRLAGRRVVVIDDAISSGQTAAAAITLAGMVGAVVAAIVVAMVQGDHWRAHLAQAAPHWHGEVRGAFYAPRLVRAEGGWVEDEG